MAETVLVLVESGQSLVHDLPLPEGLAQRVATGEAKVLGPCDDKGELLAPVEPVAEPEPAKAEESPAAPGKRVPRQRTQED